VKEGEIVMLVQLSFKHLEPTEALKNYAREKTGRLEKYFQGRIHVEWHFTSERQNTVARCHLRGNHMDYMADAATPDSYASIDLAVDRIEKQLKKHKEMVKHRLHRHDRVDPEMLFADWPNSRSNSELEAG
jgi:putative sigma-54 modulation protein